MSKTKWYYDSFAVKAVVEHGIIAHKFTLKREPRNVRLVITHAIFYIFETSFSDEGKPPCRVTLAFRLVTLAVSNLFTLSLAELPKYLQIQAVIIEFLFHIIALPYDSSNISPCPWSTPTETFPTNSSL